MPMKAGCLLMNMAVTSPLSGAHEKVWIKLVETVCITWRRSDYDFEKERFRTMLGTLLSHMSSSRIFCPIGVLILIHKRNREHAVDRQMFLPTASSCRRCYTKCACGVARIFCDWRQWEPRGRWIDSGERRRFPAWCWWSGKGKEKRQGNDDIGVALHPLKLDMGMGTERWRCRRVWAWTEPTSKCN